MNSSIAKTVGSDDGSYGKKRGQWNIGVVTPILMKSGVVPTINLLSILDSLGGNLYVIEANADGNLPNLSRGNKRIHIYNGIKHKTGSNIITRIGNYIYTQVRISHGLLSVSKNVDLWIFYGGQSLLLPMLIAKLLKKDVILAIGASFLEIGNAKRDILSKPTNFLVKVNFALSNRIILYSPNLIKEWNLEKYRNKISIAHKHFLDFDKFKMKKKFGERDNLVGYIGRLSEEKGTLNFVKAIPEMSKEKGDLEFLIGGDGQLCDKIEKYLDENNLNNKIKLVGWIPHDELPDYLNELELVVLPSYTEGLPNLMLEAMACGTPVLATPVGAIPDVITDGETGFIMEDNSPACITENVVRVLERPDLERIVENARVVVEREFTYEAAVEQYRKILEEF